MRSARILVVASASLAIGLAPIPPASAAAGDLTWPQVQAGAKAAQAMVTTDGGTITLEVSGKISFTRVTDYRPGGTVTRARYREAGMADSQPDEVTWAIVRNGAARSYQPMPPLPKPGLYPTLRKASWVRLSSGTPTDVTTPIAQLLIYDPLGAITSGPANEAGLIEASWTHGINGSPASAVTAMFMEKPTGTLVLQSFTVKDVNSAGPPSSESVRVDFTVPRLTVPNFASALPKSYVKAAMDAAGNTTSAYYSVRNAATSAREKAATMTRSELIAYARSQVAANQDFSHPPANPSKDVITNVSGGLRLTNPNAYSGQSTTWTLTVTPDKQVLVTKRTKPSKVVPVP